MRLHSFLRKQAGATLVEVLLAIALSGIMLPVLAGAFVTAHAGKATSIQQLQANSLLQEATDAVRSVREKGWSNVATDGTYHPAISTSAWSLVAGAETINGFSRQIVISSVQRNSSGVVVAVGGTNDPSTKHVVVTVGWTTPFSSSISTDTYLTRWQNNTTWSQTTQADFNGGTLTNTCATATCTTNLAIDTAQLQDSPATWQLPSVIGTRALPGNVAATCVFVATIGTTPYAFVGYATGMVIIDVSNPAAPTQVGTYNPTGGVNDIYVVGTTAYLATTNNTAELTTVNVSNPAAPTRLGTLNVGDNGDANAVFVSGTYAFLGKVAAGFLNSEFYIINVTNPASMSVSGSLGRLNTNINSVFVSGNYAYLGTAQTNSQFRVVNVTNKASPSNAATVNLGATATDVVVSGTTAFITTQNNTGNRELRVYNVTTPTAPAALGTGFEVGANATGVSIDPTNPTYAILATAGASKQGIITDVSAPATGVTLVNNLNLGSTTNKVFVSGRYAYFASTNTTQGLTIVYTGFRPTGTLESSTFNAGANVGFNSLYFTATEPTGTTLQLQVAANNTGTGWSYVGPDGTSGTYFTAATGTGLSNVYSIPLTLVSNQYFRYKVYFTPTANGQQTPVLNDVTVNYSP